MFKRLTNDKAALDEKKRGEEGESQNVVNTFRSCVCPRQAVVKTSRTDTERNAQRRKFSRK